MFIWRPLAQTKIKVVSMTMAMTKITAPLCYSQQFCILVRRREINHLRSNEGASRHVNKNGKIQKRASVSPPYWFLDYKTPKKLCCFHCYGQKTAQSTFLLGLTNKSRYSFLAIPMTTAQFFCGVL